MCEKLNGEYYEDGVLLSHVIYKNNRIIKTIL